MSKRGRYGAVAIIVVMFFVLGSMVGCKDSKDQSAGSSSKGQPTHDQIAGTPTLRANADKLKATIVTPHMAVPLEGDKNVLWCASFQLAWNELADLLGDKLAEYQGPSEAVGLLNQRSVTKDDLDEESYIAIAGYPTGGPDDILNRIKETLVDKFDGAASPAHIPMRRDLEPNDVVVYAYLFKSLPFSSPFGRSRKQGLSFEGHQVQTFGLGDLFLREQKPIPGATHQVYIIDYQNENDFIISLNTRSSSDKLILAKIPALTTLEQMVRNVQNRITTEARRPYLKFKNVQIPVLNFDLSKNYGQLIPSGVAIQQIRFRLDEIGAVLKSEAAYATSVDRQTQKPVDLIFDKPFLIMLQRRDAANPYFALWVANAELLVPVEKKP